MQLYEIQNAFADEVAHGFAVGCVCVYDDSDESRGWFTLCLGLCADFFADCADCLFVGATRGFFPEDEAEKICAEFKGFLCVDEIGKSADFYEGTRV